SLMYKLISVEENLNINHDDIITYISENTFNVPGATHVVTGIKWGSTMIASFEYEKTNEKDTSQVKGILKANLEMLSPYIPTPQGTGDVLNVNKGQTDIKDRFSIKIFGDVITDDKILPQSFDDAKKIMAELPSYVKKYNHGKGVPIELKLYPLSKLARQLKQNITINCMITELNEESILKVEQVFDNFLKSKKMLNDLYNDAQIISDYIKYETLDEIEKHVQHVEIEETNIRKELADCLVEVRSGKCDTNEIEKKITKFQESILSKESILTFIKKYKIVQEKANLIFNLKTKNVEYVKKDATIDYIIQIYQDYEVYILLDNDEYIVGGNSSPEYTKFQDLFKNSDDVSCKFLIAELKICTRIKGPGYPIILHYIKGKPAHDSYSFVDEEINILLLGEVGVGKSTFINSFANYFTFNSLDDARSKERVLIPSEFIITDSHDKKAKLIKIGENDLNEQFKNKEISATRGCKKTSYHPGNTLPPLKKQLSDLFHKSGIEIKAQKDTIYCLDNEAFRFLAAAKKIYLLMLKKISRLVGKIHRPPHKVKETLLFNKARRVVEHLEAIQSQIFTEILLKETKIQLKETKIQFEQKTIGKPNDDAMFKMQVEHNKILSDVLSDAKRFIEYEKDIDNTDDTAKIQKTLKEKKLKERKIIVEIKEMFDLFLNQNSIVTMDENKQLKCSEMFDKNGSNTLFSLSDIDKLEDKLYNLPIFGRTIYKKFEEEFKQKNNQFRYLEHHCELPENNIA
ncbi:477_t:CDS:2, partial [Racocetra fulgida]